MLAAWSAACDSPSASALLSRVRADKAAARVVMAGFASQGACAEASAQLLRDGKYPEGEELICPRSETGWDLRAMPAAIHDRHCLDLNFCLFKLGERHSLHSRLAAEFDPQGLSCPAH